MDKQVVSDALYKGFNSKHPITRDAFTTQTVEDVLEAYQAYSPISFTAQVVSSAMGLPGFATRLKALRKFLNAHLTDPNCQQLTMEGLAEKLAEEL